MPRRESFLMGLNRWAKRLAAAALMVGACTQVQADDRLFTYTYETTTMPKGQWEYEQWVTWKADKKNDSDFSRLEFRHEIEWAITDRWQAAIYLSDWRYTSGNDTDEKTEWRNVAFESIYQITDPVKSFLGSAVYGEIKGGDELFVLEAKLLLQKNIGQWVFAYNFIFEAEWEGKEFTEDIGEFGNTFGASYQVSPSISVGAELVHEIEYDDWSEWGDHVLYAGPNASYRGKGWWITVTPLIQVTDVDSEADFQTRLLFGIYF